MKNPAQFWVKINSQTPISPSIACLRGIISCFDENFLEPVLHRMPRDPGHDQPIDNW